VTAHARPSHGLAVAFTDESLDAFIEQVAELVFERLAKTEPSPPYMTTMEAADYLRAKPQRVHDLLSARKLTRFKDGGRTLVLRAEVESLVLESQR
jgi:excisionase family DNA binding protein